MLVKGIKREVCTLEQIEKHLKVIGADKPPEPQNEFPFKITAPKQGRWGKYLNENAKTPISLVGVGVNR
ncbi:hypothetical protein [Paenibacillus lentus]|nr:hypothetical protein [Paenibacillus lentus]